MTTTASPETITLPNIDVHETQPCAHSNHTNPFWHHVHAGDATHYAKVTHDCPTNSSAGYIYPCCQPFTNYVNTMTNKPWMCPRCKNVMDGKDMVQIIATINGENLD